MSYYLKKENMTEYDSLVGIFFNTDGKNHIRKAVIKKEGVYVRYKNSMCAVVNNKDNELDPYEIENHSDYHTNMAMKNISNL